jgi:hypothetical protein
MLRSLSGGVPLRDLLPVAPVLPPAVRDALHPGPVAGGWRYAGPAPDGPPLPPVSVFGVAYDLDLALKSTHPDFDLHEVACIRLPDGDVWFVKDADAARRQTVVADLPDLQAWWPEVPLQRARQPVAVTERRAGGRLSVQVRAINLRGEPYEASFEGPLPRARPRRNSSTMGHSADSVLAVLDLSAMSLGRGHVRIGGRDWPLTRFLGAVPFATALVQSQGGLAVGAWRARGSSLELNGVAQDFVVRADAAEVVVSTASRVRRLVHRYLPRDGHLELWRAEVHQSGRAVPVSVATFTPALPDPRGCLAARAAGAFVLDVGGQRSHGVGRWEAAPDGRGGHRLRVLPEAPRWVADRPLAMERGADGVVRGARIAAG